MANVYCVDLIACLFYFDNILPEDLKNKSLNIREYISNEYQKIIKQTKSKQLKEFDINTLSQKDLIKKTYFVLNNIKYYLKGETLNELLNYVRKDLIDYSFELVERGR